MRGHHPPAPQSIMEVESVLMLVERIGLPAVIIGIMCWYIFKTQQSHKEEIIRWEEKDTRGDERLAMEIKGMAEALIAKR